MVNREHIEAILKVNGVPESSPDEHIRSVLLSARYNKDEVDSAIMVLRENDKTKKTRVDGLHKVFRTSDTLSSEEISQLLGIEVSFDKDMVQSNRTRKASAGQIIVIWASSFLIASLCFLIYMYIYKVGIFHPSLGISGL